MLRKLNFGSVGSFGGNMEAMECYRRGYQILISDHFGGVPQQGGDWGLSIYKRNSLGDYDENPLVRIEGTKFDMGKVEKRARGLLWKILSKKKKRPSA